MKRAGGAKDWDGGWNTVLVLHVFTITDIDFVSDGISTKAYIIVAGGRECTRGVDCGHGEGRCSHAGGTIDHFSEGIYNAPGFSVSQFQQSEHIFNDWNIYQLMLSKGEH